MVDKQLYVIDATAFCYRAFYALPKLATSFGQPTNAVYGFLNILNKILKEKKPDYLAVCFDISRDTFRLKKFAEYKMNRPPMPDGLSSQIPLIKDIVLAYGITIFEKEGFEADDIIATIAFKAKKEGLSTTIVSSDKDILQLVNSNTAVFSPYKDEGIMYDEDKVFKRFGVKPQKISDIIALMGDSIDNIPGVPGIGEKTAINLIREFGSLDKLLDGTDKIKQEKLKKSIEGNISQIRLSRELAVLDKEVDIDFSLENAKIAEPNTKELFRLFKYLELKKFLKETPVEEGDQKDIRMERKTDKEVKDLLAHTDTLFLYGLNADDLVYFAKDKFFYVDSTGDNLRSALENPNIKKISHDLKKIKTLLADKDIILKGLYFDTMIAAYLLNPSKPEYGIKDVCLDYLNLPLGNRELQNKEALDFIIQLRPKLEDELKDKSLWSLFSGIEMPLTDVLARMELNGIKIDLEVLKSLSADIEKRLIRLIEDIYSISGIQFNINSPKQLREVLFERLKLPVVKRSKTGPSTDEEVLRSLAGRHKLPALLLEYRQLTKLKNTYIDSLPELVNQKTGRIHTSFNQTATETGRLSSSNPNLQNIPIKTDIGKNIRKAIISSRAGNFLLSCDYSQVELRILAHLAKDENLITAFKMGKDFHKATAALIYGVEEKDVDDTMRDTAKRVNFGIVYGLTSYGLSRDLSIPVEEAQKFIDAYFARYPRVQDYMEKQILKAQKDGFVATILSRRRYIPEINNKNQSIRQFAQRQAINTPIQGSASDLIKLAMIQIDKAIEEKGLESRMILQIHDELLFDVPKEELRDLAGLVKDRMEGVLDLGLPIKVDIKKGKNWLEMEEVK